MQVVMEWRGITAGSQERLGRLLRASTEEFFKHFPISAVHLTVLKACKGGNGNQIIKMVAALPEYTRHQDSVPVLIHAEGSQGVQCFLRIIGKQADETTKIIEDGPYCHRPRVAPGEGAKRQDELGGETPPPSGSAPTDAVPPQAAEVREEPAPEPLGTSAQGVVETPGAAEPEEPSREDAWLDHAVISVACKTLAGRKAADEALNAALQEEDNLQHVIDELQQQLRDAQIKFGEAQARTAAAREHRQNFEVAPEVLEQVRLAKARLDSLVLDLSA